MICRNKEGRVTLFGVHWIKFFQTIPHLWSDGSDYDHYSADPDVLEEVKKFVSFRNTAYTHVFLHISSMHSHDVATDH